MIKSRLSELKEQSVWSAVEALAGKAARLLFRSSPLRYMVAILGSLLLHAAVVGGYLKLSRSGQGEVLEIREITFVDLSNESTTTEPRSTKQPDAKESNPDLAIAAPEQLKAVANTRSPAGQPTASSFNAGIPRRQVPISLASHSPIAIARPNDNDIIRVSSANGRPSDRAVVSTAAVIDLDKQKRLKLASTTRMVQAAGTEVARSRELLQAGNAIASLPAFDKQAGRFAVPAGESTIEPAARESGTFISGPLAARVIKKKVIPQFPRWARRKGVGAAISLQFTVMPDGSVKENIAVVRTSGSKEWDDEVVRALGNWFFAPLLDSSRKNQTGLITFQFKID